MPSTPAPSVRLQTWQDSDLDLLRRLNAPELMVHLGGPESEQKLLDRHQRFLLLEGSGTGRMFTIRWLPEDVAVGSVGYWDRAWNGMDVHEAGWAIDSQFHGRGLAAAGTRAMLEHARAEGRRRFVHAYPKIDHPASNGVCRAAGFTQLGECDFEYPPGNPIRCNDWRYDLEAVVAA